MTFSKASPYPNLEDIYVPRETQIPTTTELVDLVNGDSETVDKYTLLPSIIQDLEAGISLSNDESAMYFPENKDYDGGMYSVKQPAFLLIRNKDSGDIKAATNKFLITQWQETRVEKLQVLETFNSSILNFFDEKTRAYVFAGVLLEGERTTPLLEREVSEVKHTYLWSQSFRKLWDDHLRGTKLVESNNIAIISMVNNVMFGYPVSLSLNTSAQNPDTVTFQMQFICTSQTVLGERLEENYSIDTFSLQPFLNQNPTLKELYLAARREYSLAITNLSNIDAARQNWERSRQDLMQGIISSTLDTDLGLDQP